ncbi:hypothetical protein F5878DRAFT_646252 [Lentinula raphanica]|uniref:Uncharacterized protein n=1 Tax=Lentinula raphanica TaxID=153919 RepID=A0AA38NYN0_9AGAR|nr:hypothetical protein F5878DRAFT_646252 [Lentinula raphanica]
MLDVSTLTSNPPPAQHQASLPGPQASTALDVEPAKKKRGPKSALSEDQIKVIQSHFPAMEKLLVKHSLHAGKEDKVADPDAVVTWFDDTITKILNSKAFETLDKSKKTSAQWRVVVRDVFKNYRNNTFIPKNQKTLALRYLNSKNKDTRNPDEFAKAADALVSFRVPAAPKKLFERANKEAIMALMNKKIAESNAKTPGVDCGEDAMTESTNTTRNPNPAALYQNALTELWAKADKQDYIDEASSVDIFKNQAMFQESMYNSLCALAEGGAIGPTEMLLWVGFRDEDNVMQCLRLHAHHRFDPDNMIKPFIEGDDAMKIENAWEAFCEETIPHHRKEPACSEDATGDGASNVEVLRNATGVPVLPEIDFDNTTRIQLSETLITFRKALWDFSYPADNLMPSVPVARISANPEDYIDIETFAQAAQLATVESLDLISLFSLAKYLGGVSNATHPTPFTFRSKDDIRQRVHDRSATEERERQTGDEIVYVTQTDNASTSSKEPAPSITSIPSPALATEQQIVASTSVDPADIVQSVSVELSATPADPPSTVDLSSSSATPADPASTVDLSSSTSVDRPANIVPSTSVDRAATSAHPPSTFIDHSPTGAVPTLQHPEDRSASVDVSGSATDTPHTPPAINSLADSKKRKRSIATESHENNLLPPKTRKRARASGAEDQGRAAGRVTRASMKQAEEQEQTSRTLRGARRGNAAGGPSDQVKKRKGRR